MRTDIAIAGMRARCSAGLSAVMLGIAAITLFGCAGAGAATLGTGLSHSCALADAGRVKCWGSNAYHQLGDGTTTDRLIPVDVTALTEAVTAIAVGGNHACGLNAAGGVKCWGLNQYGQLGGGSTAETSAAVDVVGLQADVVAIAGGRRHACALTSAGAVKCWGSNEKGQLGDGSTTDSSVPVDVVGLQSGVAAISAGAYDTCAVTSAGAAKCWGDNVSGQLGDGSANEAHMPVDVVGLSAGVVEVAITEHLACARLSTGGLKCWGAYALGNGTSDWSLVPVDVQPLGAPAVGISVGLDYGCALTSAGFVKCWGYNANGELGDGSYNDRLVPTLVQGLESGVVEIVTSTSHTCARLQSDELRCWGWGTNGQLGDGVPIQRTLAVDVAGLSEDALSITSGPFHTCALTAAGAAQCWGGNLTGALGDGTTIPHWVSADVMDLHMGVATIAAGMYQSCALTTAGGVLCWGQTAHGPVSSPEGVTGLATGTRSLVVGSRHACAVSEAGGAKCWGENGSGQLGNGATTNSSGPVDVTGLTSGVTSLAAGYAHSCAITTIGSVKCWGSNSGGELGDGTTTPSTVPVDVVGLDAAAVAITAGASRTCALTGTGRVVCWGAGITSPTEVAGLGSDIVKISAGTSHVCAIDSHGGLKCWGRNKDGQLGDGTLTDRAAPAYVTGLTSGVATVSAGDSTTCAVTTAGAAKCWGSNALGQLGNGQAGYAIVPRTVVGSPFSDLLFRNGFD